MGQLGFGCANLASMAAGAGGRASVHLVQHAFDRGITFFDTADAYGDGMSERVLGRAFRRRPHEVTIGTKAGYRFEERPLYERAIRLALRPVMRHRANPSMSRLAESARGPAYVEQDFSIAHLTTALENSLRRLGRERIDLYQLHEPTDVDADAVLAWAAGAIETGKIDKFGVSVGEIDAVGKWLGHSVVTSVQLPFGLLEQRAGEHLIGDIHGAGSTVIARGVLGSGLLSDRLSIEDLKARTDRWQSIEALRTFAASLGVDTVQLAFWYVRARTEVSTFLVGMSSTGHVDSAADASRTPLPSPDVLDTIESIVGADSSTDS